MAVNPPKTKIYRLLEIIPGLLVWLTFAFIFLISIFSPKAALYLIIVFSLFWLFRVIYFVFYISIAWKEFQKASKINWLEKVQTLPGHKEIYHLVFLPTAKESIEILRTTFNGLKNSHYSNKKMIVVLAGEERSLESFKKNAEAIKLEFGGQFHRLLITVHPDKIKGELRGKGANAYHAGREAKKLIDQLGLPYEKTIVSYFDCDTVVHPYYFAHLTYQYLKHPNPTRASFQPPVLYSNNLWQAPAISRVVAFSTTFWLLSELVRPDRLFTFSSHSMSFKALVDVDFWQKDIVTDDSRIFLQCFFHYNGQYTVEPLFIPLYMDAVLAENYWQTIKNLYKQQRRWAWGVEHFPYMVWRFFFEPNTISRRKKIKFLYNFTEGMYSWASAPVLLFFLGRLPFWFASGDFKSTLLAINTPVVLQWLMTLSMAGIFTSVFLSWKLLPPEPKQTHAKKAVFMLQWVLLPITLMVFGALPATDAQSRLMLGRYLGFWVTDKSRGNETAKATSKWLKFLGYES